MKSHKREFFSFVTVCYALLPVLTRAANVAGTVVDQNGNPLAGAIVLLMRYETQYAVPAGTQMSFSAETASSGQFQTPTVPDGNYMFCVIGPDATYLNPCEWFATRVVSVSGAGSVDTGTTALEQGSSLTVTIQGPQGLVPQLTNLQLVSMAPKVIVGLIDTKGQLHRARPIWSSGSVSFPLSVPPQMPEKLWVFSNEIAITDSTGTEVEQDQTTSSTWPPSSLTQIMPSTSPSVTLTAAGTK